MNQTFLVMDMGQDMLQLVEMLDNPNLPTFDKDALLDQIVETVCCPTETSQEIASFKQQIMTTDLLYTGPMGITEEIAAVTTQIGLAAHELAADISRHGLLQDNYFNYKFHRNVHDQTIVFSRKDR